MKKIYKILYFSLVFVCIYLGVQQYNLYNQKNIVIENFLGKEIYLNPYKNSPLTGIFDIEIPYKGFFKIKVKGQGSMGIPISYDIYHSGGEIQVPILGLYSGSVNQIEITFTNKEKKPLYSHIFQVKTSEYKGIISDIEILTNNIGQNYQGLYGFVNSLGLFDQTGNIRWYGQNEDFHSIFRQLKNGNFLITSKEGMIRYQFKSFYEVTPLGEVIAKYSVPRMYHHEILELENGNFLTTGNSEKFSSLIDSVYREDTIVEIDRKTGKIIDEFNVNDVLGEIRPQREELEKINIFLGDTNLDTNTGDWAHINSLYMDENNNVIFSMRTLDMVSSINWRTKKLNWVLSHTSGDFISTQEYDLEFKEGLEKEQDFYYPLAQHSAILKDSNLYIFDNGNKRGEYLPKGQKKDYSRVLKYHIDEENRRINSVSSFIHPQNIYTPFGGNVSIDSKENMIIGYTVNSNGGIHLLEVNNDNSIIFEAKENSLRRDYRAIKIDIIHPEEK